MKSKTSLLLLSLLSALLLSVSWYWHLTICIFFAFVPLLILEETISSAPRSALLRLKLLGLVYVSFFTWNVLVTWWVVYASFGGASMAFILNSLLMAYVFLLYSNLKRRINKPWAVWLLIPLWMAWEHGHTLWDLSWTWLTLGNVFAFNHNWIQWYEFTGTSGGTFWILATNILVFQTIKHHRSLRIISKPVLKIASFIVLPILLSYAILMLRLPNEEDKHLSIPIVLVQPNIDPYNDKFNSDFQSQFLKTLTLLRGKITEDTRYLVFPETFITENLNEATINNAYEISWFRDSLLKKYPKLKIISGGNTYVFYQKESDVTSTARKDEQSSLYYDVFNTAIQIDTNTLSLYHKSKLVPGVEQMPFPSLLKPLERLAINMGGTMGSLGKQEERSVFKDSVTNTNIAPVICYESVYADYVSGYIRNGANLIFIITNDGWWDDTPGYKQHLNYARLRAIENRREIARCANTGVSCFVDEFGNISNASNWWKTDVISKKLHPKYELTFFSRFGDILSYMAVLLSIVLVLWLLLARFRR